MQPGHGEFCNGLNRTVYFPFIEVSDVDRVGQLWKAAPGLLRDQAWSSLCETAVIPAAVCLRVEGKMTQEGREQPRDTCFPFC